MSTGGSFWKRVGSALRADSDHAGDNGGNHGIASVDRDEHMFTDRDCDKPSLLPWVRRQRTIERLDQRYQRVLEIMDVMSTHFEAQDRRAAEVTAGLARIGGTLEQLAEIQRGQSAGVSSLTKRVDEATKYSADLATMLVEMPASLQAQAQAVHAVARQMESARACDVELTNSLQQFSQAAESLRQSGTAQVESLQNLHDHSRHQRESLRTFVKQQTRLLLIITIIVAVLGLGAVAALTAVVHMVFNAAANPLV